MNAKCQWHHLHCSIEELSCIFGWEALEPMQKDILIADNAKISSALLPAAWTRYFSGLGEDATGNVKAGKQVAAKAGVFERLKLYSSI